MRHTRNEPGASSPGFRDADNREGQHPTVLLYPVYSILYFRVFVFPWPGLLELRSQPEERGLIEATPCLGVPTPPDLIFQPGIKEPGGLVIL